MGETWSRPVLGRIKVINSSDSFEDRYVQGTVMNEQCYPDGDKHGGWISTAAGNVAVAQVDTSDAYWLAPGEPLPRLDRDVRYRLTTAEGATHATPSIPAAKPTATIGGGMRFSSRIAT